MLDGAPLAQLFNAFEPVQTSLSGDYGDIFFLGFMVDVAPYDDLPTSVDAYGWAKLQYTVDNSSRQLVLLESAVSDAMGIRAGQFVAIPEPGIPVLLLLGGCAVCCRRRDHSPASAHPVHSAPGRGIQAPVPAS